MVKKCLAANAAAVIFAHNHPSGVAEPSDADINITRKLTDALALIDVRVLDHLIIGQGAQTSLAERGFDLRVIQSEIHILISSIKMYITVSSSSLEWIYKWANIFSGSLVNEGLPCLLFISLIYSSIVKEPRFEMGSCEVVKKD